MIVFDNVSIQFPNGHIGLRDVSFRIEEGEFVFLVGPSGAGKTTILKLILGALHPSAGAVQVGDQLVSEDMADVQRLRRSIGIVFQDFKILPDKNIFENVAVALKIQGAGRDRIAQEVSEALSLVSLAGKEQLFPVQLSAGELQRVAIARAIVGDRRIIIADEPTGNLDPKTAWEIMKIFKKLEKSRTILIATHNTDVVNSLRKRVFVMNEGRLTKDVKKGGYES